MSGEISIADIIEAFAEKLIWAKPIRDSASDRRGTMAFEVLIPNGFGGFTPMYYRGPVYKVARVLESVRSLPMGGFALVRAEMDRLYNLSKWVRAGGDDVTLDEDAWRAWVARPVGCLPYAHAR